MRKTLKEARAIARLFLHCVGEPARVTIAALAATRRQIGRARDLDVMAVRLERLAPPPEVAEPLMAAIAREREAALRARRGAAASAPRARLNAIAKRLARWDLSAVGDGRRSSPRVARTYRQARRRGRLAFDSDDPAALHAFRARVVDLRYQLALLACAWPEALNAQAEALGRASRGARRPSTISMCWRNSRPSAASCAPQALDDLTARTAAKQKKLSRRAEVEFDRLFAETPSAFEARLAAYLARPVTKPGREPRDGASQGADDRVAQRSAPMAASITFALPAFDRRPMLRHRAHALR